MCLFTWGRSVLYYFYFIEQVEVSFDGVSVYIYIFIYIRSVVPPYRYFMPPHFNDYKLKRSQLGGGRGRELASEALDLCYIYPFHKA